MHTLPCFLRFIFSTGLISYFFAENIYFLSNSSSQSAKYSNVEISKGVKKTASNDTTVSPRGSPALEQYRQSNDAEVPGEINHSSEEQNALADGILMEQLAGIRGAIDAMENTENSNEEEDSLSLIMNVIENEDLSSVLDDMPWNFM